MVPKRESDCCESPQEKDRQAEHAEGHDHDHEHNHDHDHDHGGDESGWRSHLDLLAALAVLSLMLILEYATATDLTRPWAIAVYVIAYLLAGRNTLAIAARRIRRGDVFNEFFLMTIATIGAFAIGEYAEGVAVMIFYAIGEWFQDAAVNRARHSIKALLDVRPDTVTVLREGLAMGAKPEEVRPGDIIQVKPGEKVALDGELLSARASFNTAALTGESIPDGKSKGESVLAGMINLGTVAEIRVTTLFKDSKLSRILDLVEHATARKSQTQLFISRFARIYTPVVVFLALGIVVLPVLFADPYIFREWLYRALVFLVISCPCALVISIPLGYFGGVGLASRNGILFKGSNFLDVMTRLDTVVMDKTGTLTRGVFNVRKITAADGFGQETLLRVAAALEAKSTHPVAAAIVEYAGKEDAGMAVSEVEELAGQGIRGRVDGDEVLAGNAKFLQRFRVDYPSEVERIVETFVLVAVNGKYAGCIVIADELKDDAAAAVAALHKMGIQTVMLSGDKSGVVQKVAGELGIRQFFGDLLPEDKVAKVQALKDAGHYLAFAGDGVNDAPVVALADAGIAMGGLGSDATIETADVVIQNDQPSKIALAVRIGKITRGVVWQNIGLAMSVKVVVLALGAGGVATLWEAVFADVGVALLVILNAVRIQKIRL